MPEQELKKCKIFEFETITVNAEGKISKRQPKQAHYQTIELDKDIILEMVYIPGGTFMMGSPETEKQRWESESPQHQVTVEPFYMSKYPIAFYFGETITTDLANYDGNYSYDSELEGIYRQETTEVGIFPPNAFGLYDMHGNVYEWCIDPWHDDYYENTSSDSNFCLRSGSWLSSAWRVRSAYRNRDLPSNRNHNLGFRVSMI